MGLTHKPLAEGWQGAERGRGRDGKGIRVALLCVGIAALGALAWWLLRLPMDVPDASSPALSSYQANVDAWNWVGQSFVARRDNLDEMSLVLATEQLNDYSSIDFVLRDDGPDGPILRSVKLPIAAFPEGNPFTYRPSSLDELWTTISFEPIPGTAGRTLFFELRGTYVPPVNRVRTLMMFPSKYPKGKAYVNGEARNADVVFRSHARGQASDYIGTLAENLTTGKVAPLANVATYAGLGAAYLLCLGCLFVLARRFLSASP